MTNDDTNLIELWKIYVYTSKFHLIEISNSNNSNNTTEAVPDTAVKCWQ